MRFTKPINREVDIDGNTFIVSFDDSGVEFRLKGKRRTARADWTTILGAARGEGGESAHELLGLDAGNRGQQTDGQQQPGGSQQAGGTMGETARESQPELGRAVTAGDVGPES